MGFGGMVDMVQNPSFAVAVGLLVRAARYRAPAEGMTSRLAERSGRKSRWWSVVREWF